MTTLECIKLFRDILSPDRHVSAEEIQRMGLLAVKIAQMYAVRSDLINAEKCAELSILMQRANALNADQFRERWKQVRMPAFDDAVANIEPSPMAAASLGQVHRARLRDGSDVVVKISKRDEKTMFSDDLKRVRLLARIALTVYPKLQKLADPLAALEAVERQTLREMNFMAEISGARRLAGLAHEHGDQLDHLWRVHFPNYFTTFSNDRFLVSEFIEGPTLAESIDRGEFPYEALLDLFRIHGFFLFVRGEFHGDLHPGNVIWRDGEFWFLDNANIETVPVSFSRGLFEMLVKLGQGDYTGAANQLMRLSINPLTNSQMNRFQSEFTNLYRGFAGKPIAEVSLTNQMMRTVKTAVAHGITFPRDAFPVIKSLMYMDGMALRVAPEANLLNDVARFAADFPSADAAVPSHS